MSKLYFQRMKALLKDEYDEYIESLSKPLYRGLRVNTKKISIDQFKLDFDKLGQPSVFCPKSFYVDEPLGLDPYHVCGLFYLQEPSASSAVEILDVQPDDIILDLCAAPGGKSTQIADKLDNGFLVTNEIDSKRAQALLSNVERIGVKNVAVTNTTSKQLTKVFHECFDRILVDAPCSGEGMIKKHDAALKQWSLEHINNLAKTQAELLEDAYVMLKQGGTLVYSTCTYALEEDEDVVLKFMSRHEDIELVDPHVDFGRQGFKDLDVRRIFPMDGGEGHFIAKFKKQGGSIGKINYLKDKKPDKLVDKFIVDQTDHRFNYYHEQNGQVFGMDVPFVDLKKLKVLRQGVYLGDIIKNRFEPAHAFYLVSGIEYRHIANVDKDEMDHFMHGEILNKPCDKGYVAVCYKGHCFGFGKSDGKVIKNKIPKGLRLNVNSHIK